MTSNGQCKSLLLLILNLAGLELLMYQKTFLQVDSWLNYQCMTWLSNALFWPYLEGAGNCFSQSLRANPIRGTSQHRGLNSVISEVPLPEEQADRNVFVWLTWLYSLLTGNERRTTPSRQFDFLIPRPDPGVSVLLCVWVKKRRQLDGNSAVVWGDAVVVRLSLWQMN